jgi:hypothetical protein
VCARAYVVCACACACVRPWPARGNGDEVFLGRDCSIKCLAESRQKLHVDDRVNVVLHIQTERQGCWYC